MHCNNVRYCKLVHQGPTTCQNERTMALFMRIKRGLQSFNKRSGRDLSHIFFLEERAVAVSLAPVFAKFQQALHLVPHVFRPSQPTIFDVADLKLWDHVEFILSYQSQPR